jgi:hypothetical protein
VRRWSGGLDGSGRPPSRRHRRVKAAGGSARVCCGVAGLHYARLSQVRWTVRGWLRLVLEVRHRPDQQDAYALLAEGVRLESKGDTAGALAKYETVMENFPGTGAAKDAEFSIRNLRDTLG